MKIIKCNENNEFLHYNEFVAMLIKYLWELKFIDGNVKLMDKAGIDAYLHFNDTDYYLLQEEKTGEFIGLAVIGSGDNCSADSDVYIQEFYIRQDYRRKGYGTAFIKTIMEFYNAKDAVFYVIKKNAIAVDFWINHIFFEHSLKQCEDEGYEWLWEVRGHYA